MAALQSFCDEFDKLNSDYALVKIIGSGGNGVVFSARNKHTGKNVAIKKLSQVCAMPEVGRRALREIKLLRHLSSHENIATLEEVIKSLDPNFDDVYLVQHLMQSDLSRILKSNQNLTEDHYQYFLYQILKALKFIHSAGVLHRDLKPSNILINEDCELRICDFGMARGVEKDENGIGGGIFMTEYVATRWYRAPEIMFSFESYSKAVDIWSVGCIFAEMFWRKPFFPGKDYVHQLKLILAIRGTPQTAYFDRIGSHVTKKFMKGLPIVQKTPLEQLFAEASPLALDLLDKLLKWEPEERLTAEQALQHPYLANYHDPLDEPTAQIFDYSFEEKAQNADVLRGMIYEEMCWKENQVRSQAELQNQIRLQSQLQGAQTFDDFLSQPNEFNSEAQTQHPNPLESVSLISSIHQFQPQNPDLVISQPPENDPYNNSYSRSPSLFNSLTGDKSPGMPLSMSVDFDGFQISNSLNQTPNPNAPSDAFYGTDPNLQIGIHSQLQNNNNHFNNPDLDHNNQPSIDNEMMEFDIQQYIQQFGQGSDEMMTQEFIERQLQYGTTNDISFF